MESQFLYATCQAGAEPALKQEVARDYPDLRFAFSRPGFVTFKSAAPLKLNFDFRAVFARAWGLSLGKSQGSGAAMAKAAAEKARALIPGKKKIRLHVWERDRYAPEAEPKGFVRGDWEAAARDAIFADPGNPFEADAEAKNGEMVFDIVVVEANEWWFGAHAQTPERVPFPGSRAEIALPEHAPSRAYLKIEEGILWARAPIRKGDRAIEVGSAPGGASYALLQRGVRVLGIDPAAMDRRVLAHPDFKHLAMPVSQVTADDLPVNIQWLALDMNVAPSVSLYAVDRIATLLQDSLLGALLTVKLNDWKIAAEIPGMIEHLGSMGFKKIRATQLPSNRQEIFFYALTAKGEGRKS